MKNTTQSTTDFDLAAADMSVHFQTARKIRSAEAHKLFKAILNSLTAPVSSWKTRYILALSRTA
ncbi:hypothetical protein WH96_03475 [Kiloniella spongiae]|uniref:Uncharacterized protein n=1 Tax=Kiloniella spongiae TaxID=1489064 RepID=A0A0H2MP53_9PROT|nr:hypothetical protein [Kiloniella spongiae]KLN62547.1 hypothetical protein WH96_03475 [Kiloniella spongiae]